MLYSKSVCVLISDVKILRVISLPFYSIQVDLDSKLGKSLVVTKATPQSLSGGYVPCPVTIPATPT